jgi:hypothetical protein
VELDTAKSNGFVGQKLIALIEAWPFTVIGKLNLRQYRVSAVARCLMEGYFFSATLLKSVACAVSPALAIFTALP